MGEPRSATRFVGLDTVALVDLVRVGDADAYGELYKRYHDFAYTVARRSSRPHADDLVAESFRRVLTAISHGAGPTQGFGPYLAATIRSAAAGLAAPYQEVELQVSHLLADERGDVDPRVSSAYLALPEQWQNALWYSDVEGLSPRHAAPLLGLPSANSFSALRLRARAGLRSAYLTQVVDEACNEHVRRHLQMLMAGATTASVVDDLVDEHLRDCDVCAAIAWRVAAVTGNKVGAILAPALLAFHGFAITGALLPAGLGLPAVLVWLRGLPKPVAAAGTTATVAGLAVTAVAIGSMMGGSAEPSPRAEAPSVAATTTDPDLDDGGRVPVATTGTTDPASARTVPSETTAASTPTTGSTVPKVDVPATDTSTATASTTDISTTTTSTAIASTAITTTSITTTTIPRLGRSVGRVEPTATATGSSPATSSPATSSPAPVPATSITATTTSSPSTTTTSTTTPSTTSTTTTSTSTTTTTLAPVAPGRMAIAFDSTVGSGSNVRRFARLEIANLTGLPGTITFSRPIEPVIAVELVCSPTGCTLGDQPGFVMFRTELGPLTIHLRDGAGSVTQSIVLP